VSTGTLWGAIEVLIVPGRQSALTAAEYSPLGEGRHPEVKLLEASETTGTDAAQADVGSATEKPDATIEDTDTVSRERRDKERRGGLRDYWSSSRRLGAR